MRREVVLVESQAAARNAARLRCQMEEARRNLVWIASYPKSGNTWARFLLANYLAGPIERSDQVEALIPGFTVGEDKSAYLAGRAQAYGKTHYPWNDKHPHASATDRAIVVVRNPRDVLLSNLNYVRVARGTDLGFSDLGYARTFIKMCGDPAWLDAGIGTLEEHCESWLGPGMTLPRLVLRYEELKSEPGRELRRVVEFLGMVPDPERIDQAVKHSSFEQMRAMEVREKAQRRNGVVFPGPAPRPGWRRYFMNEGKVGSTLAHINPDLDREFDERFKHLLSDLGYAPVNGSPH